MALPGDISIETVINIPTSKYNLKDLTPFVDLGIALTDVKGNFKIVNPLGVEVWNNTSTVTPDLYSFSVSSITRIGTVATVTTGTPHGLITGDWVTIAGADQSPYNGTFQITKLTNTIFTYAVAGSPVTPATGTIIGLKISLNTISLSLVLGTTLPIQGNYLITLTTIVSGATEPGTYVKEFSYNYNYVRPTISISQSINYFIPRITSIDSTTYMVGGVQPTIARTHTISYPVASGLFPTSSIYQTVFVNSPKVGLGVYTTTISSSLIYINSDGLQIYDRIGGSQDLPVVDYQLCNITCCIDTLNQTYENQKFTNPSAAKTTYEILDRAIQLMVLYTSNINCGKTEGLTNILNSIYAITGCTSDCGCGSGEGWVQIPPISGYIGHTILDWTDFSELGVSQYDYVQFINRIYQAKVNILPNESPATNPEKYTAQNELFYVTPEYYGYTTGDATAYIQQAVDSGFKVILLNKTYPTSDSIALVSGVVINGSNSTISPSGDFPVFTITGSDNTIEGIIFLGTGAGSSQHSVSIIGAGSPYPSEYTGNSILNCRAINMGGAGTLYGKNVVGADHKGNQINSCWSYGCGQGLFFDERFEYTKVTNCTFIAGTMGIRMAGGNNSIANCNISNNTYNIYLEGGSNGSHSTMVGGNLNHALTNDILANGCLLGFSFVGVAIYGGNGVNDGDISIINSQKISIQDCMISVEFFNLSGSDIIKIQGNTFHAVPTYQNYVEGSVWWGGNAYDGVRPAEDTVPVYADNAAATLAGLKINMPYRTGDTQKVVH